MRKRGAEDGESTINGSVAAGIVEDWWSTWARVEEIWNAGDDKKILLYLTHFSGSEGGGGGGKIGMM
jgi:hypothetical protein